MLGNKEEEIDIKIAMEAQDDEKLNELVKKEDPVSKANHMEFLTKMRLKIKKEAIYKKDKSLVINEEAEKRRNIELAEMRRQVYEEFNQLRVEPLREITMVKKRDPIAAKNYLQLSKEGMIQN